MYLSARPCRRTQATNPHASVRLQSYSAPIPHPGGPLLAPSGVYVPHYCAGITNPSLTNTTTHLEITSQPKPPQQTPHPLHILPPTIYMLCPMSCIVTLFLCLHATCHHQPYCCILPISMSSNISYGLPLYTPTWVTMFTLHLNCVRTL